MRKKQKEIKIKNYLSIILILIGVILLVLYIFKWYELKKEEKLMTSYLIKTKTINSSINNLELLKQIMQEAPSSYFIYLSYTDNENIYNFEKKLKRVIDKYNINDIFYYVDLTELIKNDNNYLSYIKNTLKIAKLSQLPAIIYVHDGKILNDNILDGVNISKLKTDDLEKLLNIYEFKIVK